MVDEKNESPIGDDQDKNIPDWMREAGWTDDSGTFDESKPVFDDLEGEEDIIPAEIPAWLEEAAPEGYSLDSDPVLRSDESSPDETAEAFVEDDFSSPDVSDEPVPDQPEEDLTSAEIPPEASEEPELDVPSWLENLELDEDSQETAVAWLENMPESLRATEEELEQARQRDHTQIDEPEIIEDHEDELSWVDDLADPELESQVQAELSEDLVASDLIPEEGKEEKIFGTEELKSPKIETPDWFDELSDKDTLQTTEPVIDEAVPDKQVDPSEEKSLLPDWLSELDDDIPEEAPTPASELPEPVSSQEDLPDWLGERQEPEGTPAAPIEESSSLAWLESLAEKQGVPEEELISTPDEREIAPPPAETTETTPSEPVEQETQAVSPNDDTLSTAIPDWLSKIADAEEQKDLDTPVQDQSDFEDSSSWLEQLEDQPAGDLTEEDPTRDNEVLEWLDGMSAEETGEESTQKTDIEETPDLPAEIPEPPILETAKYFQEKESEEMPDWLSELEGEETEDIPLESALKEAGHPLSDKEMEFIEQKEELAEDNADWLAKLDLDEEDTTKESDAQAIKVDFPAEEEVEEAVPDLPDSAFSEDVNVSGGILDRLKDTGAIEAEPEIPHWLENLKKEEDPQETAVLWLKQFVEQGDEVDLNNEIKRYTDELDPGDTVPKWMEDLKKEEDPQTTAMLWLEKLSGDRPDPKVAKKKVDEPDETDWLTALEKEEAEHTKAPAVKPTEEFADSDKGWLADLEIDEKIKSEDEDIPEWMDLSEGDQEEIEEGETPPWMKATSPLEGDFHTDELAGEEKEVEIPEWLAGYAEGEERPDDAQQPDSAVESEPAAEGDDYTWVSETSDQPKPSKTPIDLNKAAISQLEGILGISYQVAVGIVRYREEHGPFRDIEDLENVPEITNKQTIEILKPEVIIGEVEKADEPSPKPEKAKKTKSRKPSQDLEETLAQARSSLTASNIEKAVEEYELLIKKKKSLPDVISDLEQAAIDNPLEVLIFKTLGDAHMKDNNLEEALEAYTKAEDLLH